MRPVPDDRVSTSGSALLRHALGRDPPPIFSNRAKNIAREGVTRTCMGSWLYRVLCGYFAAVVVSRLFVQSSHPILGHIAAEIQDHSQFRRLTFRRSSSINFAMVENAGNGDLQANHYVIGRVCRPERPSHASASSRLVETSWKASR